MGPEAVVDERNHHRLRNRWRASPEQDRVSVLDLGTVVWLVGQWFHQRPLSQWLEASTPRVKHSRPSRRKQRPPPVSPERRRRANRRNATSRTGSETAMRKWDLMPTGATGRRTPHRLKRAPTGRSRRRTEIKALAFLLMIPALASAGEIHRCADGSFSDRCKGPVVELSPATKGWDAGRVARENAGLLRDREQRLAREKARAAQATPNTAFEDRMRAREQRMEQDRAKDAGARFARPRVWRTPKKSAHGGLKSRPRIR